MLSIVGTPIGNLDDLSIRQAKAIANADIILSEDTRSTSFLLQKIKLLFNFDINPNQRMISYYKEKEFEKLPEIINLLTAPQIPHVILISESGMPLISDPGLLLVQQCIKKQIPFEVIPGPTAVTTALVHSGFNSKHFMYVGFLPKKKSEILQLINRLKSISETLKDTVFVAYDSPNRINTTLELFNSSTPNAEIVVCRELTKKFEEIIRGKPKELLNHKFKGETTIVFKL